MNDFKLERFFAKYEFTAPYILCASDCESFSVQDLFDLDPHAEKDFKNLRLGYTESNGNPALREEISKMYTHSGPENVLVFAGAEEGIFVFMNTLLDPGDHIIVQAPCYQSLYDIATVIGCDVTQWLMNPGNHWELDLDFLENHITPKTKAIIVNSPNNPTGYLISRDGLNRIVETAKKHGVFIFSDEVYRFLEYDEKDRLPSVCDIYDKSASLGVMSKSFGLPGLRIGWIATQDKSLFDRMASFKDFTTICSSAPSEFLTLLALRHKKIILDRNLEIIRSNLKLLESFLNRFPDRFEWIKPKAGPLVFPKLKFTDNAEPFCRDLVEKKGVLLAPGITFNYKQNHVRFGFGRANMPEALTRLEEYIKIQK